jgi:hypothetical protein
VENLYGTSSLTAADIAEDSQKIMWLESTFEASWTRFSPAVFWKEPSLVLPLAATSMFLKIYLLLENILLRAEQLNPLQDIVGVYM